uniref:DNA (cytosine-5-)-methyltransferase n=1 Tax=viral metagenome TaxID=1070528 RepID=A0A6M3M0G6_9ZZZZ
MTDTPTVISTFAGCGGSSQGYKDAGFHELVAVEWDEHACDCLRINFPGVEVVERDIAEIKGAELLEMGGDLAVGDLDVFDGSPPCQGFSTTGRREITDNRNQLYMQFCRLLGELKPRAFIMENVSGMVMGAMRPTFHDAMKNLTAQGYRVSCRKLNSWWYGVPQSRDRLIFVGIRNDLPAKPSHPNPERRSPVTTRRALSGVEVGPYLELSSRVVEIWDVTKPGQRGNAVSHLIGGKKGSLFNWTKVHPDKPCPTIATLATLMHWSERRMLSTNELKRLASFPDAYEFPGNTRQQWARIGNSVPPGLMRAVASHVRTLIDR